MHLCSKSWHEKAEKKWIMTLSQHDFLSRKRESFFWGHCSRRKTPLEEWGEFFRKTPNGFFLSDGDFGRRDINYLESRINEIGKKWHLCVVGEPKLGKAFAFFYFSIALNYLVLGARLAKISMRVQFLCRT